MMDLSLANSLGQCRLDVASACMLLAVHVALLFQSPTATRPGASSPWHASASRKLSAAAILYVFCVLILCCYSQLVCSVQGRGSAQELRRDRLPHQTPLLLLSAALVSLSAFPMTSTADHSHSRTKRSALRDRPGPVSRLHGPAVALLLIMTTLSLFLRAARRHPDAAAETLKHGSQSFMAAPILSAVEG